MQCQQRVADAEWGLGQRVSEFEAAIVDIRKQFNLDRFENAVKHVQEHMADVERILGQRTSEMERALSEGLELVEQTQSKVDKKASEQQLGTALNDVWEQLAKIQSEVSRKVYQHELHSTANRFEEEIVRVQGLLGQKMSQVELVMTGLLPRIEDLIQQHTISKRQIDHSQQHVTGRKGIRDGIRGKDHDLHDEVPEQSETISAFREQLADLRITPATSSTHQHLMIGDAGSTNNPDVDQLSRIGFKARLSGKGPRGQGNKISDDVEGASHQQKASFKGAV